MAAGPAAIHLPRAGIPVGDQAEPAGLPLSSQGQLPEVVQGEQIFIPALQVLEGLKEGEA